MADSAERQRRLRERRRQIGAKPYEVWLDPRGQALVSAVQQPGGALDALVRQSLRGGGVLSGQTLSLLAAGALGAPGHGGTGRLSREDGMLRSVEWIWGGASHAERVRTCYEASASTELI